jgi:hypothetical protein
MLHLVYSLGLILAPSRLDILDCQTFSFDGNRFLGMEGRVDDDDDDINLRPRGMVTRPPEGYRDVLSWGIIYKM